MAQFEAILDRASHSFSEAALRDGLVEVATTFVETPVGTLLVAATDDGIVRVGFDTEGHEQVLEQLATSIGPRIVDVRTPLLNAAAMQFQQYFAGGRDHFDLPIDLRLTRGPFRREVVCHLRDIPFGETRTYTELAAIAGRPRAVRAVGSGCATNPVPIIVPCHRVLRSGGALGGYLGGLERKRWLLDHEQRIAS